VFFDKSALAISQFPFELNLGAQMMFPLKFTWNEPLTLQLNPSSVFEHFNLEIESFFFAKCLILYRRIGSLIGLLSKIRSYFFLLKKN
jgi:hypothetical protein